VNNQLPIQCHHPLFYPPHPTTTTPTPHQDHAGRHTLGHTHLQLRGGQHGQVRGQREDVRHLACAGIEDALVSKGEERLAEARLVVRGNLRVAPPLPELLQAERPERLVGRALPLQEAVRGAEAHPGDAWEVVTAAEDADCLFFERASQVIAPFISPPSTDSPTHAHTPRHTYAHTDLERLLVANFPQPVNRPFEEVRVQDLLRAPVLVQLEKHARAAEGQDVRVLF
jgi:hypothetical protein